MHALALTLSTLLLALCLSGCASTTLVSSQTTPGTKPRPYSTLLVVGLSEAAETRQTFEEIFANGLRNHGVQAIPSYTVPALKERASREALAEAVRLNRANAVLMTRFLSVKNRRDTKAGFVMTDRGVDVVDYYDYYGNYWEGIGNYASFDAQPVDEIISSVTSLEISLFDAATGAKVWSGRSEESHAERLISSTQELADLVIKALAHQGFISSK